jgi:hypothetical protein
VQHTAFHWLRFPTGFDANTGMEYLDLSALINAKLPGIGNRDLALNPGETVIVSGIELMGRRTTSGLLMAVWADPPGSGLPGTNILDTDRDGIPNAWELLHPGVLNANNPSDSTLDSDGDGMSNGGEYTAGTDPADAASRFVIRTRPNGKGVEWDGRAGRIYSVWASRGPGQPFKKLADGIAGAGPATACPDDGQSLEGEGSVMIYRVEAMVNTGDVR